MKQLTFIGVLVLSLLAVTAMAGEWTGYISESKCGTKHADASEKSINCVKGCVKGGAAPVFVHEGKVIKIANADKVMSHLGHKVTLAGKLDGDNLTVDSVRHEAP